MNVESNRWNFQGTGIFRPFWGSGIPLRFSPPFGVTFPGTKGRVVNCPLRLSLVPVTITQPIVNWWFRCLGFPKMKGIGILKGYRFESQTTVPQTYQWISSWITFPGKQLNKKVPSSTYSLDVRRNKPSLEKVIQTSPKFLGRFDGDLIPTCTFFCHHPPPKRVDCYHFISFHTR